MPKFKDGVITLVKRIPKGRVMSYGQIAACLGRPRAAREVGWALRAAGGRSTTGNDAVGANNIPWWRVVNNEGRISIKGNWENPPELQRKLLEADGVPVSDDFTLDIAKHRFHPPSGS